MSRTLPCVLPLLLMVLTACPTKPGETGEETGSPADMDNDGYLSPMDCDDADPGVHPNAEEVCDGIDNDCDGQADNAATDAPTWYTDGDNDGYGDAASGTAACTAPEGSVSDDTDCDDGDPSVHPSADEVCNGADDDCDDDVDEDAMDASTWYSDRDGDGWGNGGATSVACDAPDGMIAQDGDCDDNDADVYPGSTEVCDPYDVDEDCDGQSDDDDLEGATGGSTWYPDTDADGWGSDSPFLSCETPTGAASEGGDCDDTSVAIHPEAPEVCDGQDNDCDDAVDEGSPLTAPWYADADLDGYGDPTSSVLSCMEVEGHVTNALDCDDANPSISPAATEVCDAALTDEDCDGAADDADPEGATGRSSWYPDLDLDGHGDAAATPIDLCSSTAGWTATDGADCNDADAAVGPDMEEVCNGVDDDCDGVADDEATGPTTWYLDADGDGYGVPDATATGCAAPDGYVAEPTDCDDTNAAIHPLADETCNSVDDDCDGVVDGGTAGAPITWYQDLDGDNHGTLALTAEACERPEGFASQADDCDDTLAEVNPSAPEVCDGLDNDCEGTVDGSDATDAATWYGDNDGDGWGSPARTEVACTPPSGFVATWTDCDDESAAVYPGATEVCGGVDDDCDGLADGADPEGVEGEATWYRDSDSDGWGDASVTLLSCDALSGWVADATDCDDTSALVHPDAVESCDGRDEDCDSLVDEAGSLGESTWYADADADGWGDALSSLEACAAPSGHVADDTDCDDTQASVYPGAEELCNDQDDDCDGSTDEDGATGALTWYRDADLDGWGDASDTATGCVAPSGYVADATDCDDADGAVHPGAEELCNDQDDDCNGTVDDTTATDAATWYLDGDADGYGDPGEPTRACSRPDGYVSDATDCDDTLSAVSPAATETCNSRDDDCDGTVDEATASDAATWYRDADADGWGDASTTTRACSAPTGFVADATDCDDTRSTVSPAASETCNSVDDDCDGTVDEDSATDAPTWYQDADGDSYGDGETSTRACKVPAGFVADDTDCDDTRATSHPGATETCNTRDDDCDGTVDEASAADAPTWYRDVDGDSFGDLSVTTRACEAPSGYVSDSSDCDDGAAAVHPGADELCNGDDDNCDGTVDESTAVDAPTWYRDVDGDSFGSTTSRRACSKPSGYVSDGTDCDDTRSAVNPDADELCDSLDNDCDGSTDEASAVDAPTWYMDDDGDGYGALGSTTRACAVPSGYVDDSTDCDDGLASVNPGATEACDPSNTDEDCDGLADDLDGGGAEGKARYYPDADGDTYGSLASAGQDRCDASSTYVTTDHTDCDDTTASTHPGGTEVCNGEDDDCDGTEDEASATDARTWYPDADGDAYGDAGSAGRVQCWADATWELEDASDCDDTLASVNPSATDACGDGVDQDCSGADVSCSVEWCNVQWPESVTMDPGDTTDVLYGRVYSPTRTPGAGAGGGIQAEVGWGPRDTDAQTSTAWTWTDAVFNTDYGNDDEYMASLVVPTSGAWAFAFRFSGDMGATWTACDLSGSDESSDPYDPAEQALLTVRDDDDADGYTDLLQGGTDCDDSRAGVNPGEAEVCDGDDRDEDCDGLADDSDPGVTGTSTWYLDGDGDGYGSATATSSCAAPYGYVAWGSDCSDTRSWVYPGAAWEESDTDCMEDADGDGWGDTAPVSGATAGTDCDDTDEDISPGAPEICDSGSVDEDCDGVTNGSDTEEDDDYDNDCDDIIDEGYRVAGDLVITEIMYNPEGTEPNTEWIEIYNPHATRTLFLDGMEVYVTSSTGTTSYKYYLGVGQVSIGPMSYAVFGHGSTTLGSLCTYAYGSNTHGTSDAGATYSSSWALANSGTPTLRLSIGGVVIDELTYQTSSAAGWPSSSNGYAIQLGVNKLNSTSNDSGSSWCLSSNTTDLFYESGTIQDYGTPGETNSCTK